jgi:hypothetical protein
LHKKDVTNDNVVDWEKTIVTFFTKIIFYCCSTRCRKQDKKERGPPPFTYYLLKTHTNGIPLAECTKKLMRSLTHVPHTSLFCVPHTSGCITWQFVVTAMGLYAAQMGQ